MARERIPENQRVRASGERDAGEVVVDAELVAERGRHGQAPGALREQQRAVDIEEPDERGALQRQAQRTIATRVVATAPRCPATAK